MYDTFGDTIHKSHPSNIYDSTNSFQNVNDTNYVKSSNDEAPKNRNYNYPVNNIPNFWRVIPIVLYLGIAVTSIVWVITLGTIFNDYQDYCLLYGTPKYELIDREMYLIDTQKMNFTTNYPDKTQNLRTEASTKTSVKIDGSATKRNYSTIITKPAKNFINDNHVNRIEHKTVANINNKNVRNIRSNVPTTAIRYRKFLVKWDMLETRWSNACLCQYVLYVAVASIIYSIMCCIFFTMCRIVSTGGEKTPIGKHSVSEDPSRLVLPALLIALIFTVLIAVACWLNTRGLNSWCHRLTETESISSCSELSHFGWVGAGSVDDKDEIFYPPLFNTYVELSKISSWLTLILWILVTVIIGFRFYKAIDFPAEVEQKDFFRGQKIASEKSMCRRIFSFNNNNKTSSSKKISSSKIMKKSIDKLNNSKEPPPSPDFLDFENPNWTITDTSSKMQNDNEDLYFDQNIVLKDSNL